MTNKLIIIGCPLHLEFLSCLQQVYKIVTTIKQSENFVICTGLSFRNVPNTMVVQALSCVGFLRASQNLHTCSCQQQYR